MEVNENVVRENFNEIYKNSGVEIGMCNDDWYIDYLLDVFWVELPEDIKLPGTVDILRGLIMEKIQEQKNKYMIELGLIEDESKPREDYVMTLLIGDEVSGTVFDVHGGGPDYRSIVGILEEAAGSLMFYEHREKKQNGEDNPFTVSLVIWDQNLQFEERIIERTKLECVTYEKVIDLLRKTRYFMAKVHQSKEDQS